MITDHRPLARLQLSHAITFIFAKSHSGSRSLPAGIHTRSDRRLRVSAIAILQRWPPRQTGCFTVPTVSPAPPPRPAEAFESLFRLSQTYRKSSSRPSPEVSFRSGGCRSSPSHRAIVTPSRHRSTVFSHGEFSKVSRHRSNYASESQPRRTLPASGTAAPPG